MKIGLINNEGGQAISMPENRESAEAVAKYANETLGGIGGRPIELVVCKQGEDANQARDCANRMVEAKVSAVLMTSSGQGNSMVPIVTGAGIPYVSAAGQASSELTTPGAFMWTAGLPCAMTSMAKYSAQQGMKNVTAYVIDVPAATAGGQAMGAPAFQAAGVNLKVVPIPPGTPDATPQVSAGLADNPDGVVVIGESTLCTSVFKALGTVSTTAEKMTIQPCSDPAVIEAVGAENLNGTKVKVDPETPGRGRIPHRRPGACPGRPRRRRGSKDPPSQRSRDQPRARAAGRPTRRRGSVDPGGYRQPGPSSSARC
ncbi:ABC transporter substrate-binding protein [Gordonia westfalica]|uniref:ABC transporter substrate-binding protein n=1 Tax=Gordonia westfalica TaxID=158898 RepID=A0ABU2GY61_9ACTN|nr:ABC transporter substrate-binding protein [Gordonia westfalica]MDS1115694.1 ABC transporter substrate-binding protein [Gordonia westfalica]